MAVRSNVVTAARPLLDELDGSDHLYLHDGWLAVLSVAMGDVALEPRPLTSYRQHKHQSVHCHVDGRACAEFASGTRAVLADLFRSAVTGINSVLE